MWKHFISLFWLLNLFFIYLCWSSLWSWKTLTLSFSSCSCVSLKNRRACDEYMTNRINLETLRRHLNQGQKADLVSSPRLDIVFCFVVCISRFIRCSDSFWHHHIEASRSSMDESESTIDVGFQLLKEHLFHSSRQFWQKQTADI